MSKKRDTFIFKKSWADALKKRSTAVQLEVYNAIVSYAVDGIIPEISEIAEVVFDFIRIEIDENNTKYEETVKKRREAGRRGMESRWNGKNGEVKQEELPVYEEDGNKYNKSNTEKQSVIKVTNDNKDNKCYQNVTNVTDSDNDSVSVNILTGIKKETISSEIVKKEDELLSPLSVEEAEVIEDDGLDLIDESIVVQPRNGRIDYARIVNLYRTICVNGKEASLSDIRELNDNRKKKVKSRFGEMGKSYEKIGEVFHAVMESDFLVGKNDRGWAADFDWIFQNKNNWLKVLEGRYRNRDKVIERIGGKSQLEKNVGYLERTGVKQENVIF